MDIDSDQISSLARDPSEALQVEAKTWLDPRRDPDIAKLIKAIFALRNRNGGFLLIGFDNTTMCPDTYSFDEPVGTLYHQDVIQGLVSRFANQPFEVAIRLVERADQAHPIIAVPEGVRVPAVVKRDLVGEGGKRLLSEGDVYFRTLQSNGTASSARLSPADYPELLEICFENREADIGRFLRRHLPGVNVEQAAALLGGQSIGGGGRDRANGVLESGAQRFASTIAERSSRAEVERTTEYLTMHVGLALAPPHPDALPTQEFMNIVASSNPRYSGWPVWLDARGFREKDDRPYVADGAWQALIADLDGGWSPHLEFMRLDPRGEFYLRRVMQDDLAGKVQPGTALDVILMIYRVTEVLAVGISLARRLGWEDGDLAHFAFRWTGLRGRKLSSWVNSLRFIGGRGESHEAEARSYVAVPIDTPHLSLAPYVSTAVGPLFASFEGYTPSTELLETSVRKVIERKMDS
jgi:hypothetical protein